MLPHEFGAGNESRTRDLNLGKVALYQLSYSRDRFTSCSTKLQIKYYAKTEILAQNELLMSKPIDRLVQMTAVPNTLGLPCEANQVLVLSDRSSLPSAQALYESCARVRVIGGGSNVVLPENLADPLILMRLQGIKLVEVDEHRVIVDVAAGENWHQWVQTSLQCGWPGLENLALIPGSVGAAPVQNIGAYGVEIADRLLAVEVWDFACGQTRWLTLAECAFGYRDSVFKQAEGNRLMVLTVRFSLPKPWRPVLDYPDLKQLLQRHDAGEVVIPQDVFRHVVSVRQSKLPDPAVKPNAGSFFKNPIVTPDQHTSLRERFPDLVSYAQPNGTFKLAAGWLIDQCGYKGVVRGQAAVHDRQALVLVNVGHAKADDILTLAQAIADSVHARFSVDLDMEPVNWAN